ncbi:lactate oxidase [Secundilactobacillus paracollinoides]|uniref:L-lactate oxidase n=1 Tax=Secundilactobacillus paracollinoides TaxID=240427 RepID=A0A1B2IV47_9LACO|nr:lactate oxidase [Secundilactobacillus paracollinoides]ANZ60104.1 lactate oxidase [Secundilactobacillus paracollinoides]ANZ62941.1 lactate oxidase [Secundilactobacillus paracollinoides]ANZ65898.1 lactate oxidase [Secundilactobacillus paracollinoides]KRL78363.1 L-lactate oxidase [Secundilactobacillus paracollinoides DSM 15502 = JCM 11969]
MVLTNGYEQNENENPLDILNLTELEGKAKAIIPTGGFGYISGGSEDEWTLRANRTAFQHRQIVPKALSNIENPSTDTTVFGIDLKTPIMMAPTAAQGLAHAKGEVDTAAGVAAAGGLMAQSTYSSTSIADTAAGGHGAPQFFQLYMSKDWSFNESLLDEAKKAGVKGIILTVDATVDGYREADIINNFQFPIPMANLTKFSEGDGKGKGIADIYAAAAQKIGPDDVRRIAEYTDLPVIVKGVESPEDALYAIGAGAAGIYVSNHGGRQLNGGPASFDVLESVAKAVNHRVPVIFDSGVRRGSDVFKALASGADLVAMGRPAIYGLALGGAQGVESVFTHLNDELKIIMQLAGTKTIADVKHAPLLDIKY